VTASPRGAAGPRREGRRRASRRAALLGALLAAGTGAPACDDGPKDAAGRSRRDARHQGGLADQRLPELLNVRPLRRGPRSYDFMVLLSSPDDRPRRHAAGRRLLAPGGPVLAGQRLSRPPPAGDRTGAASRACACPSASGRVRFEAWDSRYGYAGGR
jgi:hypothetical protein